MSLTSIYLRAASSELDADSTSCTKVELSRDRICRHGRAVSSNKLNNADTGRWLVRANRQWNNREALDADGAEIAVRKLP